MDIWDISFIDRIAAFRAWRHCAMVVACFFRLSVGRDRSLLMDRARAHAVPLADTTFVLSGGHGHQLLCYGQSDTVAGHSACGWAVDSMGPGFGRPDAFDSVGTFFASLAGGRGDGRLFVFLLL